MGEKGGKLDAAEGGSSVSVITHRGENRRTVGTVTGRSREWREAAERSDGGGGRRRQGRRREREEAWGRWLLCYGRHHHPSHPIVNSEAAVPNLSPCVLVRTVFYRCLLLQAGSNTDISALPALCDALASALPITIALPSFLSSLRLFPAILSLRSVSVSVCFCPGAWENAYANEKNR